MLKSKVQVRTELKLFRSNLTQYQKLESADRLCRNLLKYRFITGAKRVGVYLPYRGEIDLFPWIQLAWRQGKALYLPVVGNKDELSFVRYTHKTPLKKNKFNILEPANKKQGVSIRKLDVILAPMVAFDVNGFRLGMGGGFYDRTLHYKAKHRYLKPAFVGVGYHWQLMSWASPEPWDIKLDVAITDKNVCFF